MSETRSGQASIPLVLWGASGHARVVADAVRLRGTYTIAGFLDDLNPDRRAEPFGGAQILGGQEQLEDLRRAGIQHLFLAFGDCRARLAIAQKVRDMGFQLPVIIHPGSTIARGVVIGAGTVVVAGAVVNAGTVIGENAIINTSCSVDHDCWIADGVHVGPGAHLGGHDRIGRGTWIGIGAILKDRVAVGAGSIIGAGAVVLKDIPDGVTAFGVPARIVSETEGG